MMPRPSALARLEDLEFLLEQGVPILEAVSRCGWTRPNWAEVTARRHDRPDLARALSREAKARAASSRPSDLSTLSARGRVSDPPPLQAV